MAEQPAGRVWNRTVGQWLRSVALVGLGVGAAGAGLFGLLAAVWGTVVGIIGDYIGGLPHGSVVGGALAGASLGLAAACAWGWLGRPRLVAANGSRTGGNTSGARYWNGGHGDAPDSDPGPEVNE